MPAADRTRRSPLACLLVALFLALGLNGAAQAGAGTGAGHPMVTTASGVPGPQAVLDLHIQFRLGVPRPDGLATAPSAPLAVLLIGRRRRRIPARAARGAPGRPPRGGRAPPASPPVQGRLTADR
jgi:hypothetical protein